MTLVLPTSRASLVRPLTESVDAYDNPDTPGTTYSFQDPAPLKPTMQAESSRHLAAPILDASMLMSTDDEMLDSDSDQRRDEDFDIDLDAEAYSVSGGDLEINMTMEDDSVADPHVEPEADNDDIMLDDEPVEYSHDISDTIPSNTDATTGDERQLQSSDAAFPSIPLNSDSEQPELPHQDSNDQSEPGPEALPRDLPESEDVKKPDSADEVGIQEPQSELPRDSTPGGAEHQQAPPIPVEPTVEPDATPPVQEENDGGQSSTATLTQEAAERNEQYPANDVEQTTEHEPQTENGFSRPVELDSFRGSDPYDSPYQYPIIVQYGQIRLALFPPMSDWSEDAALAEVYSDIPSDYLLNDVALCDKPIVELLAGLRTVLCDEVGDHSELIIDMELLGLKIGEDNSVCKSITLRYILDMHNQLYENDGYDIALPVNMSLYTVPRFHSRLEAISVAVRERKGLQECLGILDLPPVGDYPNQEDLSGYPSDTNDPQKADHSPVARETSEHAPTNELGTTDQDTSKDQVEACASDGADNPATQAMGSEGEVAVNSMEPGADAFAVSNTRPTKTAEQSEDSRHSSLEGGDDGDDEGEEEEERGEEAEAEAEAAEEEEEEEEEEEDDDELLEYEDENDSAKTPTDQSKIANSPTSPNKDGPSNKRDPTLSGEQVSDNGPLDQESDVTVARLQPKTSPTAEDRRRESPSERDEATYDQLFGETDDNEEEFDNEQQGLEEAGFDQGEVLEWYQDHSKSGSEIDGYVINHPISHQHHHHHHHETGDAESYDDVSIQDGGPALAVWKPQDADSDHEDIDKFNFIGDIYEANRGDHTEEVGIIRREIEYKYEEGGAPFDPSAVDAVNVITHSPLSSDEEELIDYEDDQDEQPPTQLQITTTASENNSMSPTSLKRFRENSDDQEEDEGEAEKNQASKRVRAE